MVVVKVSERLSVSKQAQQKSRVERLNLKRLNLTKEGKSISVKCETALVAVVNLDDNWGNTKRNVQF
jgi:hypothetical protein